jgi:DNA-binding GntR family transcriptional regulator
MISGTSRLANLDLRISRKTVQQEAVEKLKGAILSGMFQPGDRLVEANLCEMLGISRQSVREALRSLEAEHLVEIVPNRGPQIPILSWEAAAEIYDVRALLEGEAAGRCASSISDEDLAALSAELDLFRDAVRSNNDAAEVRHAAGFYAIILRNCGNHLIEQILNGLFARINFLRARSMSLPGRAKRSLEEMNAMFAAIKSRDPAKARRAAAGHVSKARDAARKAFDGLRACPPG